jgi:hypothetical protein
MLAKAETARQTATHLGILIVFIFQTPPFPVEESLDFSDDLVEKLNLWEPFLGEAPCGQLRVRAAGSFRRQTFGFQ